MWILQLVAQIVQRLLKEVEAASAAMLGGLLGRLQASIQLPECLRVVGCLRRLAPFPEPELRRRWASWIAERVALLQLYQPVHVYSNIDMIIDGDMCSTG